MQDDLIPFFVPNNLYLKPIHKLLITVVLPKLRQMGQSISNWEIRERLKKMLDNVQLFDFKVLKSSLESVQFVAVVNTASDYKKVSKLLNGVCFRAIGFTEPLTVHVTREKLDFPTRIDWDKFFEENSSTVNEKNPGERPDTVYIGGLPFEWFKTASNESYEDIIQKIFSKYGEVMCVDIPQCNPLRREMDSELSGIQLSVWLFGEDVFFEAYVQFKEYISFKRAMAALSGKNLVQKINNNELRETKIKVDFDRTAHLSAKKIRERELKIIEIQKELELKKQNKDQVYEPDVSFSIIKEKKENQPSSSKNLSPQSDSHKTISLKIKNNKFQISSDNEVVAKKKKIFYEKKHVKNEEEDKSDTQSNLNSLKDRSKKYKEKYSKVKKYSDAIKRQLIRSEKQKDLDAQISREHELRHKLKTKLNNRLQCKINERKNGAKALLTHVAKLHETKKFALKQILLNVNMLASEYVKEKGLPEEDELRKHLLQKYASKIKSDVK